MSSSSLGDWTNVGGAIDMKVYNEEGENNNDDIPINLTAQSVNILNEESSVDRLVRSVDVVPYTPPGPASPPGPAPPPTSLPQSGSNTPAVQSSFITSVIMDRCATPDIPYTSPLIQLAEVAERRQEEV